VHVTYFSGGKTDAFPASSEDVQDVEAWLQRHAGGAPGHDKSEKGFVIFCRFKPGTDVSIAEINLARAKEEKPPLNSVQEGGVRARGYRNYAHVEFVTAIGIDYDGFPDEPPNWDPEVWPCDVYAHSTHNYHPTERPGKWRAILPLATPMPIEREAQLRKVLQSYLPRGAVLRAPHQPAFLPTCAADATVQVVYVEQPSDGFPPALDWTKLVDLDAAPTVHATGLAASTLIGSEFANRGMVRRDCGNKLDVVCPWASEHKSGGDLGYVYYTEDGTGNFKCEHGSCKGIRNTPEAYEFFDGTPNSDIPEPLSFTNGQMTAAQPITGGEPVSQPVKAARFIGWPDLMTPMGEVPWLVRELEICPGRPPMFISDSGVGKTWTLQALALAVASGQPVFGRFACRQGPVLHLSRDSGLRATKARYQRLARGMGIDRADVVVFPHSLPLTDKMGAFQRKGFEEVAKEAERGKYALVILDSLAALCPGIDENSTDIGEPLRATTDDECVWLWAHHTTKSGEGYRGSGAIKAAAGSIYVGTRDGERRIWSPLKASEEHESGDLPKFETEWQCDEDGGARIVAKSEDDGPVSKVSEAQRQAWEMLKLVELRGKASTKELLASAGITSDVKGRVRQRANAVLAALAHPAGGLLASVESDKYILAAGVTVPRAAHQIAVSVPENVTR
jgi:hypothetical protein